MYLNDFDYGPNEKVPGGFPGRGKNAESESEQTSDDSQEFPPSADGGTSKTAADSNVSTVGQRKPPVFNPNVLRDRAGMTKSGRLENAKRDAEKKKAAEKRATKTKKLVLGGAVALFAAKMLFFK